MAVNRELRGEVIDNLSRTIHGEITLEEYRKGGITHGQTDELGYYAVQDIVHVHDFHATILHLLGIDHTRLTYRFQGRDFRLTDVHGDVVKALLA
jgi:hypothetical protein